MPIQGLEIVDFAGGISDYYLNAPQNKMHICDNMLLVQYQGLAKPFTRFGSDLYDIDYPQIPAGAQRISTALYNDTVLFLQSGNNLYRDEGTSWASVLGPTGNTAFPLATTASVFTYANWNKQVYLAHSGQTQPKKLINLSVGGWTVRNAGLPQIDSSVITFPASAAGNTYLYKFVYRSTYLDSQLITYIDRGQTSAAVEFEAVNTPNVTPVNITTIPVLTNTADDNYPTAAADLFTEVYRTTNNGTVFYLIGNVPNGTTTFNDSVPDTSPIPGLGLTDQPTLYTTGDVVDAVQPPPCSIVHIVQDKAYYAGIEDSVDGPIPNRVLQSVPGDLDAVPGNFFVDLDDTIVAFSSVRSSPVAICNGSVYRIDGQFDLLGRGGMVAERISDRSTCISAQSVVQTLEGVFWAGIDGVYFTDGYQVVKINEDYDKTWEEFVSSSDPTLQAEKRRRVQGKYDRRKRRVWWTIQHTSIDDVDLCYVLDLNFPIGKHATFTTISGLGSFSPTAIEFDSNGDLIRCDRRGYVLKHTALLKSDIRIDVGALVTAWVRQTIFYEIETIAYNFGTTAVRKFCPRIDVVCESETNLSMDIISINDDGRKQASLRPIRYRGNVVWGEPDIYWGDPLIIWNQLGLIDEQRRFPAKNLRCNYKQIRFANALLAIINSEAIGTATVSSGTSSVVLDSGTSFWPDLAVDYYMSFAIDGYVEEYLVLTRSDTTLTLANTTGNLTSAIGTAWVMRGYPKNEILNMISYVIQYEIYGRSQDVFKSGDSGEVGAT